MEILFKNANLVLEDSVKLGDLLVRDHKIISIGENLQGDNVIDLEEKYIVPGFIDMHIHGGVGHDVMDGTLEGVEAISKFLGQHGVTSYLPTMLTQSKENLLKAIKIIEELQNERTGGAVVLGTHMEGPYFNMDYKGAQNPEYIREGEIEEIADFLETGKGVVKMMSLAPEKNSLEVIRYLSEQGVIVSMGHTAATNEQVKEAVKSGLSHGTHTFNGMKGLHHREPGALGAIMHIDDIYAELILDTVHVHPDSAKILFKCKGADKLVLVSDSIMATGLSDGKYSLGGLDVFVENAEARLENGALAGSTLTLDVAFKNAIELLGASIVEAVKMTSTNQAKELKLDSKGKIAEGFDADIVVLNKDYTVANVYVAGEKIK